MLDCLNVYTVKPDAGASFDVSQEAQMMPSANVKLRIANCPMCCILGEWEDKAVLAASDISTRVMETVDRVGDRFNYPAGDTTLGSYILLPALTHYLAFLACDQNVDVSIQIKWGATWYTIATSNYLAASGGALLSGPLPPGLMVRLLFEPAADCTMSAFVVALPYPPDLTMTVLQ